MPATSDRPAASLRACHALAGWIVLASMAAAAPPDRFVPVPLVLEPHHSEELFSDAGGAWGTGPIPVGRESLLVMAAEFDRRPVQSVRFEVSSDGGSRWRTFGRDRDDEGLRSGHNPDPSHDELYDGEHGFTARLDTAGLAEGVHLVRVTMQARGGRRGSAEVAIRVMDAPPRVRIVEPPEPSSTLPMSDPPGPGEEEPRLHFHEISGTHVIEVESEAPGSLTIDLLAGSPPSHDQTGQGTLDQNDLGPISSQSHPDGGPLNMFCAPAGAANAAWRMAAFDPRLRSATRADGSGWLPFLRQCVEDMKAKHPDDPDEALDYGEEVAAFWATKTDASWVADGMLTLEGMGLALACKMKTDPVDGTTRANMKAGWKDFFEEQGIAADYTTSTWDVTQDGNDAATDPPHPGKKKILEEIAKDEMVLLTIANVRTGSIHLVTAKDYSDDGKGKARISIRDPNGNAVHDCPVGKDQNGNTGIQFGGDWWSVAEIVSMSPTDAARLAFLLAAWQRLVEDLLESGWPFFTLAVHDGFHSLRATWCTPEQACGSDVTRVYVNNLAPQPLVQAVGGPGTATLTICDAAGSEDVIAFQGSVGSQPVQGGHVPPTCSVVVVGPLPPGAHPWSVQLEDYAGATAAANGTVNVLP